MSRENVELVTRAFEAVDANGFDAALPFYATDVVIYTTPEWPGESVYRGHDGARTLNAEFTAAFVEFGWDVREMRDVGDHVVALTEQVAS